MSLRSKISHLMAPNREAELNALKAITKRLTQQNDQLAKQHSETLKVLNSLSADSKKLRDVSENIRAAIMAPVQQRVFNLLESKQLGFLESVHAIAQERKSLARFGDGEFRLMYRSEFSIKFHRNSPALMEALREVLTNPSENTLVGMPHAFFGTHWSTVYAEVWNFVEPLASNLDRCVNSHITRPVFFELYGKDAVSAWRSVWENRDATIVTGEGSRFGLHPALFNNLGKTTELFSTSTDAYNDLERIVQQIEDAGNDLALLSLGPAATIAADMLARRGIQALDIGHISSSYENVIEGGLFPEDIPVTR